MTEPAVGAHGVTGCGSTTTLELAFDVQPSVFVTVNVYVPALAVTSPLPDVLTTDGVKA